MGGRESGIRTIKPGDWIGTNLLKLSVGFTRVGIGITSLACYGVSFYLMALSYQKLPLSVAESIWAALGIIAATLLG